MAVSIPGIALETGEYERIAAHRLRHLAQVDQPLLLITQMPRSGGTLMMRLLDGHPECHTMPHELRSDFSSSEDLLGGADAAWSALADTKLPRYFADGFRGAKKNRIERPYPLLIPPSLQRLIFDETFPRAESPTEREVVDAYMTSYFNAWLDNQNLYAAPKRWVTAFAPGLLLLPGKMERFAQIYPDGRLISIVRDPRSWYVSARGWSDEWARLDFAARAWCDGARATIALRERFGDAIYIAAFEDLVDRTETIMRRVAKYLRISFDEGLLRPTFNGMPIKPNSSFRMDAPGVSRKPLERFRTVLSSDEIAYLDREAMPLYRKVLALRKSRRKGG